MLRIRDGNRENCRQRSNRAQLPSTPSVLVIETCKANWGEALKSTQNLPPRQMCKVVMRWYFVAAVPWALDLSHTSSATFTR